MTHLPIHMRELNGGTQEIYRFDNGYGASVVKHAFSYGGSIGLKELAVLKFTGPHWGDFSLCYTTHITSDVLGHLTDDDVAEILVKIENLTKEGK